MRAPFSPRVFHSICHMFFICGPCALLVLRWCSAGAPLISICAPLVFHVLHLCSMCSICAPLVLRLFSICGLFALRPRFVLHVCPVGVPCAPFVLCLCSVGAPLVLRLSPFVLHWCSMCSICAPCAPFVLRWCSAYFPYVVCLRSALGLCSMCALLVFHVLHLCSMCSVGAPLVLICAPCAPFVLRWCSTYAPYVVCLRSALGLCST